MGIKDFILGNPSKGKSYEVTVVCTNCNHVATVRISHGKTVEGWGKTAKCKVCKNRGFWQKSY